MPSTFSFDTVNGTVRCTKVGLEYDLNVQDAKGATVATLRLSEAKLGLLVAQAEYELNRF